LNYQKYKVLLTRRSWRKSAPSPQKAVLRYVIFDCGFDRGVCGDRVPVIAAQPLQPKA
jgi:hypothetical protein